MDVLHPGACGELPVGFGVADVDVPARTQLLEHRLGECGGGFEIREVGECVPAADCDGEPVFEPGNVEEGVDDLPWGVADQKQGSIEPVDGVEVFERTDLAGANRGDLLAGVMAGASLPENVGSTPKSAATAWTFRTWPG